MAFSLHHAWHHNAKPNLMANNTLKYLRVDPRPRKERREQWNQPVVWPLVLVALVLLLSITPAVVVYRRRERGGA